eukprot:TRINITY_DN65629_c0_g1_i1.p2 TRINITY_DN65629_c0_g1~~TRINITY_DN65629_c0_g1_i1.p2  ORF type:complete len:191 (+),score=58.47 TRINITY_DN65629_c0_g1_i1:67-573(+)
MGGPGYVDGEEVEEFDNFYPCEVPHEGICYPSAEHFFQAHKTLDLQERAAIAALSHWEVYAAGQSVVLRPDWEGVKLRVMLAASEIKYEHNPTLRERLLATTGPIHFTPSAGFWGVDALGRGENWNGRIHQAIRLHYRGDSAGRQSVLAELDARCAQLAAAALRRAVR